MIAQKVLIIDDDADLREALHAALTGAGITSLLATNGAEGLSLALEHKPDLILLDIMMPGMSGHEVLHALRKDAWGKTARVLFLSNLDDATNITQGFDLKGDDYLIKSNTSLAEIATKVKQYLAGYHN